MIRKINQFLLIMTLAFSISLCSYTIITSEFRNISSYNVIISLILPVFILGCGYLNLRSIYRHNNHLNNKILVISGISLSLLATSIIYPSITPSMTDRNFEKKFKEDLIIPLANTNALAADMLNSGQYRKISETFIENNYTIKEYQFKIFPNESLQENISLSKNDNEYVTERLQSKIISTDGTETTINGNVPEYYNSENMGLVYAEFNASSELNKAEQIFPSMVIGSYADEKMCFYKHISINDIQYKKEEVCLQPKSRATFTIGINSRMFPQEIKK